MRTPTILSKKITGWKSPLKETFPPPAHSIVGSASGSVLFLTKFLRRLPTVNTLFPVLPMENKLLLRTTGHISTFMQHRKISKQYGSNI